MTKVLKESFVSKKLFNLGQRVLSETEIQVLEKGLVFAPAQISIHKPEFRRDLEVLSRSIRIQ